MRGRLAQEAHLAEQPGILRVCLLGAREDGNPPLLWVDERLQPSPCRSNHRGPLARDGDGPLAGPGPHLTAVSTRTVPVAGSSGRLGLGHPIVIACLLLKS